MEQWRPISGYESFYEVSDRGRVRSVDRIVRSSSRNGGFRRRPSKILCQNRKRNGYLTVDLCKDGKIKTTLVHRLVADAFCSRDPGADQVNHKNLNKADNRADNLEWCTGKENARHAHLNDAVGPSSLRKDIVCRETGMLFHGSYAAAEWVNAHDNYRGDVPGMSRKIRACATGKQRTAYGYHWSDVVSQPSTTIPEGSTPKRVEMGGPS